MRLPCLVAPLLLATLTATAQAPTPRTVQNLETFARLYGYVRYFHPSDEAAATNWDKFAVLGAEQVATAQTDAELQKTLLALFRPIAPTLQLVPASKAVVFKVKTITPRNPKDYQVISWQHQGMGQGNKQSPYHSYRVNRAVPEVRGATSSSLTRVADAKPYQGLLFATQAVIGEVVQEDIGSNLRCVLPLALYGTKTATYPTADTTARNSLQQQMRQLSAADVSASDSRAVHLAAVVITWNIFQHFYPYFAVTNSNWAAALPEALLSAYPEQSGKEFVLTLRHLTGQLHDGHVRVTAMRGGSFAAYRLPVEWEWVQNQLVVTRVAGDTLPIRRGDIVTTINGQPAAAYFRNAEQYISAATPGWLHYRSAIETTTGYASTKVQLQVQDAAGQSRAVTLRHSLQYNQFNTTEPTPETFRVLSPGIYYLNLDQMPMEEVNKHMAELTQAKTIICDLRGYPKGNHMLISHLLSKPDTAGHWMRVPQFIYPDQKNVAGYANMGWNMKPSKPHLTARVIFITDGRAISYAESFMGFIEGYKLATIIGQPTAGTNGNINPFTVPGSYRISWTGMEVRKHDGSQHHGVGIKPNIYLEKTIQGVREGRDEFLEKAIELAKAH